MHRASLACASFALLVGCGGSSESSKPGGADGSKACEYAGESYAPGASFPSTDGCNRCSCGDDGQVACTDETCVDCQAISAEYGALMAQAKACTPGQPNQCTTRVNEGLTCGCDTFVNPTHYDEATVRSVVDRFGAGSCNPQNGNCGPCSPAVNATCSAAGVCVTDSDPTEGIACRVGGMTYQHGSVDIPDPFSCNTCECRDGRLSCTEIGCPTPCPDGRVAASSCSACGPTDECLEIETGCFPSCDDACTGTCVDGACVAVCG